VKDDVVWCVGGVAEEEVVLKTHVGNDGHLDLDEAAFVRGGDKIEAGESSAECDAEDGAQKECECFWRFSIDEQECDADGEKLRQAIFAAQGDAAQKTAFEAFQRHMWDFIPYVPVGQFDSVNAWRSNVTGMLDAYVITYWNLEKH